MNPYIKNTRLGFQLLFFIIAGYFIGKITAPHIHISETTGAAFGALFFLSFGLFKIIKELLKENS